MNHTQTHTNDAQAAKKKRKLSPLRVTLIILALLLALSVLKVLLFLTAKPTISVNYAAELDRITKPTDYDPNQNAAFDYQKALDVLLDIPYKIVLGPIQWPGDISQSDRNILEEWLTSNEEALAHVRRGSAKPYCWAEPSSFDSGFLLFRDYPPSPDWDNLRRLATLLNWHAKSEALKGQHKSAFNDIFSSFRLGSHFMGARPAAYQVAGMSHQAVATASAFMILHRRRIDAGTLNYFQQRLEREVFENRKGFDFRGEKLLALDLIQRVFTSNSKGNGHLIPRLIAKHVIPAFDTSGQIATKKELVCDLRRRQREYINIAWTAFTGPDRQQTVEMAEKLFAYYDSLKDQTPWQLYTRGIDPDQQIQDMLKKYIALQPVGWLHTLVRFHQICDTHVSALLATVAILRYKAERGKFPQTLDELLETGYLEELPMDPYSDKPLVYKKTDEDFTLYSIAGDFHDDGGVPSNWGRGGGDQVFWPVQSPEHKHN